MTLHAQWFSSCILYAYDKVWFANQAQRLIVITNMKRNNYSNTVNTEQVKLWLCAPCLCLLFCRCTTAFPSSTADGRLAAMPIVLRLPGFSNHDPKRTPFLLFIQSLLFCLGKWFPSVQIIWDMHISYMWFVYLQWITTFVLRSLFLELCAARTINVTLPISCIIKLVLASFPGPSISFSFLHIPQHSGSKWSVSRDWG